MCKKVLWCYIFILTLLDLSLNTKLTAQGESHGKIDFYIKSVNIKLYKIVNYYKKLKSYP